MATALNRRRSKVAARYDRGVDVLYVTLGDAVACEGDGRAGGIELDFAIEGGTPCGLTVIGFRRNGWSDNLDRLIGLAADHLNVPIETVKEAIGRALKPSPEKAK
jgi:hypothetical protein